MYFLFLIWNLHEENQHDFKKISTITFILIQMHIPLVKSHQQNPLTFLAGKYICQHTFANKAHSSHVYKYRLKSLCVYIIKETLQFASKNEQAVFQIDNVVRCYQEGQELK